MCGIEVKITQVVNNFSMWAKKDRVVFLMNRSLVLGAKETKGLVFSYKLPKTCNIPLLFADCVHKTRVM